MPPRLKPGVRRTKKKTSDRLASGWFERRDVHRGATLLRGLARVSQAGHTRTFRSRRSNEERMLRLAANVGVICKRSVRSSQRPALSGSGAQPAQRSRNRAPLAGSGSIHRLINCSLEARGGFAVVLVSTAVPVVIALRAGFLSPSRRSGGCSQPRGTYARFSFGAGLFEGPV